MSLSRTMDRKGSKVLKVALSAALAVAFTPVAAAPALATPPHCTGNQHFDFQRTVLHL